MSTPIVRFAVTLAVTFAGHAALSQPPASSGRPALPDTITISGVVLQPNGAPVAAERINVALVIPAGARGDAGNVFMPFGTEGARFQINLTNGMVTNPDALAGPDGRFAIRVATAYFTSNREFTLFGKALTLLRKDGALVAIPVAQLRDRRIFDVGRLVEP